MFEQAFKRIDDILRKDAGLSTEIDYIAQTSWLLFLKYLDALEEDRAARALLDGTRTPFFSTNLTAGTPGPRRLPRTALPITTVPG